MVHRIGSNKSVPVGQVALFPPELRDYDSGCVGGIGISAGPTRDIATDESAMRQARTVGAWQREPWSIRAGLVAGALTLVLRLVGVVVGPFAVVVAIVAIVFLPGPDDWADRFLVAAAALFGWLPVLGWVPKLASRVDVEGVLLAAAVGVAVAHQVGARRTRSDERRRIRPAEGLALAVGAGVALWWAIPFWRQSVAGRLRLLLPGWDNPTHLSFLSLNIKLGSFVTVQPNAPSGLKYDAWEYPQGWHQMWAQLVRLWYRHPPTDARSLVNIYTVALVLTAGIGVTLGCVAVARLVRDHAFAALVSMSVVAQLFAVGVLSMTVWFGFPNFALPVIAVAIVPSMVVRATMRPPATFFVVSGLVLICAYNWWPLALFAMPSLFIATLRLWKHAGETGRRPVAAAGIGFAALATVAPIVMTLGLGTSHLLINGGIPTMPWWLFVASTLAFVAAIVMRHVVTGDKLTTFVFGIPAVGGGLGVIGVYWYEIASHGYISYYGEKLADAVTALCLIGLALFVADVLSRYTPQLRQSRSRVVLVGLAAVLMAVAVFQINGYVGPRQQTVAAGQAAVGFQTYTQWMAQDTTLNPVADSFFDSVDATRTRIAQSGELPETWSYIDTEGLDPRMDWTDLWFASLVGGLDTPRLNRAYHMYALYGVTDPTQQANVITQLFPAGGPTVRLVVPEALVGPLTQDGSQWVVGSTLFPY
jgi:hypothetical protein